MATWNATELRNGALEYLRVKAPGQSVSGAVGTMADSIITGVLGELDHDGLTPFSTATIPEWAQQPLVKYLSFDLAPFFGKRKEAYVSDQAEGRRRLRIGSSSPKPHGYVAKVEPI